MNPEWLVYFKSVIEGAPAPPWHVWWREHQSQVEPALGRMAYLKLRFEKLDFAATILSQNGISFTWSPQGRKAAIYSRLDPSVLDDATGRPLPEYREKDGGYLEAFCSGNPDLGQELIQKHLRRIKRIKDEVQRSQELGDLEFDAEGILDEGYTEAAVAMLQGIARWKTASCLEDAPVQQARERLRALGLPS
jgi:hypothetical protein